MPDTLVCPGCQSSLRFKPHYRGQTVACKRCEVVFHIPRHDLITCPNCREELRARPELLGRRVVCNRCQVSFIAPTEGRFPGVVIIETSAAPGSSGPPPTDMDPIVATPPPDDQVRFTGPVESSGPPGPDPDDENAPRPEEPASQTALGSSPWETDRAPAGQAERDRLENEFASARRHGEALERQTQELAERLQALQDEYDQERQAHAAERDRLIRQQDQLASELATLRASGDALQERLAAAEGAGAASRSRAVSEQTALIRSLREVHARWGAERRMGRARIEDLLVRFHRDRDELREQVEQAHAHLQALTAERNELQARLVDAGNAQTELHRLRDELAAVRHRADQLAEENEHLSDRLCSLEAELAQEDRAHAAQSDALQHQIAQLQADLADARRHATPTTRLEPTPAESRAESLLPSWIDRALDAWSSEPALEAIPSEPATGTLPNAPAPSSTARPTSAPPPSPEPDTGPKPAAAPVETSLDEARRRIAELTGQLQDEQQSNQRYRRLLSDLGITLDH